MHIVIDIETLGTDPAKGPVIQMSAIPFDIEGDGPLSEDERNWFDVLVSPKGQIGREIDPDTLLWWLDTDPELFKVIYGKACREGSNLAEAIQRLASWLYFAEQHHGIEGVWTRGPSFDAAFIAAISRAYGYVDPLYKFWLDLDCRTIGMSTYGYAGTIPTGTITQREKDGRKHDAVVDCLQQLRKVQQQHQLIRRGLNLLATVSEGKVADAS